MSIRYNKLKLFHIRVVIVNVTVSLKLLSWMISTPFKA